jgi:ABC-type lipoprotein release transport system permease subunit
VAIVDDEFVRRYLPGREPSTAVGERVRLLGDGDRPPEREIVGVVRHILHSGLDEEARAEIYVPFEQAETGWQLQVGRAMDIAVRSRTPADAVVSEIRAKVRELDSELPLSHVTTLESALARSIGPRAFNVVLLSVFGAAAMLLCVVGIYGVVSYSVSQRAREIGVRMTLGAQRSAVVRMVMVGGLRLVLAGVAGGVVAALLLGRVVEGLLFGVEPRDPVTFLIVVAVLTGVAAVAAYLPARRAAALDLTAALRQD